jgi:hypothetical protein
MPWALMQGATLSHPRYNAPTLAGALNIPHNKGKGSDKSYYSHASHLKQEVRLPFLWTFVEEGKPVPRRNHSLLNICLIQQDRDGRRLACLSAYVSTIEEGRLCAQLKRATIY